MAIDTAAKRRNTVRIMLMPLFLGLNTDGAVTTDDRENAGRGYIGFDYAAAPAATFNNSIQNWMSNSMHIAFLIGVGMVFLRGLP